MPEVALYRTARQDSKIRFRMFTFIARLEENKIVHKQKFFLASILRGLIPVLVGPNAFSRPHNFTLPHTALIRDRFSYGCQRN